MQEAFPEKTRPAYTTIQTTIYRLEAKKAVRRLKKIGNAHIFEAVISRSAAQRRLIDDLLAAFGGRTQPVMAHLIESGRLDDLATLLQAPPFLEAKDGGHLGAAYFHSTNRGKRSIEADFESDDGRRIVRTWGVRFEKKRLRGLRDLSGRGRQARFSPRSRGAVGQAGVRAA